MKIDKIYSICVNVDDKIPMLSILKIITDNN